MDATPSDLRITSLTKGATSAEPTLVGLQWRDNSSNETSLPWSRAGPVNPT